AGASANIDNLSGRGRPPHTFQYSLNHMLGLRPWNQHRRGYDQIHSPKFLTPSDVLRGNALRAPGERIVITGLLFGSEFALGMSVEISPIASEGEHEQQFGIHARRRDVGQVQALDCRAEGFTEKHEAISPQEARGNTGARFRARRDL